MDVGIQAQCASLRVASHVDARVEVFSTGSDFYRTLASSWIPTIDFKLLGSRPRAPGVTTTFEEHAPTLSLC